MSEERATLLYLLDVYNKHLIDLDTHPIRKVREDLDQFTRDIVTSEKADLEKVLFRLRQFFATYRVAEYTYIRKNFEDFKGIIWNFVEQLADDVVNEQAEDKVVNSSLEQLKEAVDADSIDLLRAKSKEFISLYMDHHSKKEFRRTKRMKGIRKNLDVVKRQLIEADKGLKIDHLTQAFNRRSFDEHIKESVALCQLEKKPITLLTLDIDHFKKINDTYGHDIGDFVLKECVALLQNSFNREHDFVARIGGEEFAIILAEHSAQLAAKRAEDCLAQIRKEVFVKDTMQLSFTVSIGVAQLCDGEAIDSWLKRADQALYESKHGGRNRVTSAHAPQAISGIHQVA